MKLIIVINGVGGVGKDTLCGFVSEKYNTLNVSSVDIIKDAARVLGWDGSKALRDRKFLADLKKLSSDYNDGPTGYLIKKYESFMQSDDEVMFVHIREPEEIRHFTDSVDKRVVSLLITRKDAGLNFGNSSDDDVDKYSYDYVYHNDLPLDKAKADFLDFFEKIVDSY